MSIVNFTSGINKIEETKSLSEWAVEFISQEKLTRENYGETESFRILPRRQKDAVRYQLKKYRTSTIQVTKIKPKTPKASKANSRSKSKLKIALSIWISCFLLIDIVQIYTSKGLSPFLAWQTAILVELCIFTGSICKEKRIQKTAYAFLLYNITLFAFFEANEINKTNEKNGQIIQSVLEKQSSKIEMSKVLATASNFHEQSLGGMSKLIGKGYISSVSNALSKMNLSLSSKENVTMDRLSKLEGEITELEKQRKNIFLAGTISLLYFFLRCVLQVFSIWLLRSDSERSFS